MCSSDLGVGMKSARKDWLFLGVYWVLFTVIGLVMVWKANLLPAGYAEEAEVGDEAYKLLIGLAVPIFAGVCAALLTILTRQVDKHTSDEVETQDGPHVLTHKKLVPVWVGVSAVLAIGLAIDPGFVGLRGQRLEGGFVRLGLAQRRRGGDQQRRIEPERDALLQQAHPTLEALACEPDQRVE